MWHFSNDSDQVMHRGPVSGTGEALPDDDALAILDERVDSPEAAVPDIGVVIDSGQAALQEGTPRQGPSAIGTEGRETAPGALIWKSHTPEDWPLMRRLFGPQVPTRIVKAEGLQTSLGAVLSRSCGFSDSDALQSIEFDTPIILRVLSRGAIYDLSLSPEDCRRSDLTLLDLLQDQFDKPHRLHLHKR